MEGHSRETVAPGPTCHQPDLRFANATAVTRLRDGTWRGEIQPGWDIVGVANGGYLMAMVSRAISAEANGHPPVSISAHFTRPVSAGIASIEVSQIKSGRTFSTYRAMMSRDDQPSMTAIATVASDDRRSAEVEMADGHPPNLPPIQACAHANPSQHAPFPPPFVGNVDLRIHPDDSRMGTEGRSQQALVRGWLRLLDDEPIDSFGLILAADALPPAVFNADMPLSWTPTLELTTHILDPAPKGWLRCAFRTQFVHAGLLAEDGEIWDEKDRLVALSRQLALVPQ